MDQFIVEGGHPLSGEIIPSGNKNEALPALALVLLTDEPVILKNLPDIVDIQIMRGLLEDLGTEITKIDANTFQFHTRRITNDSPSFKNASLIRGSFLLAGSMLARHGVISLPSPGGDKIGLRPISTHLLALKELNAQIELTEEGVYHMSTNGLKGADILLDEASVMATENALLAAVISEGDTTIHNAASEPHIQGICQCLNSMGAKVSGIGSNTLQIKGVPRLHGCEYTLQSDFIEVGSFIGLAAVTKSEILIRNADVKNLRMIRLMFNRLGVETIIQGDDLLVPKTQSLEIDSGLMQNIPKIDDAPWPGFPADLVSIMTVVATQCTGTILIFEKMYESRLFWVDKLISMGAKIILCDPHRAVIVGPSLLYGADPKYRAQLVSPDIRAGMALLLAAMCAKGKSVIQNIQQIDRGYERIDERLNKIGAKIQRVKS